MLTRQILRLPWFVSVPTLLLGAVALAIGLNVVAGSYFERTFRDDADPLLGAAIPASSVTAAAVPSVAAQPSPALAGARVEATAGSAPVASVAPPPAAAPVAPSAIAASAPAAAPVAQAAGPVLLAGGAFVDGDPGHNGEGRALLIRAADGRHILRFEDFSVTNGPDLFVILSSDPAGGRASAAASDALNLGRLKATDGNINYDIPDGPDLSGVRSVIIYCRAFRVVFAVATLEAR